MRAALISLLITLSVFSQEKDPQQLVAAGVALHDRGDLEGAVAKYREALSIDPNHPRATYELALTLSGQRKYEEATQLAERGSKTKSGFQPAFLDLYGNLLDVQGRNREAIAAYKRGLRVDRNFAPLHFDLGIASATAGQLDDAREHLKRNIELRPGHAGGHFALARIWDIQGFRVPAFLAYLRFLSLEEATARSAEATKNLLTLLNLGVTQKGEKNINVTIDPSSRTEEGNFRAFEMMLALAASGQYLEENASKSESDRAAATIGSALAMFTESADEKTLKSFAGRTYGPFVKELYSLGHCDSLVYLSLASLKIGGSSEWLESNHDKVDSYHAWVHAKGIDGPAAVTY